MAAKKPAAPPPKPKAAPPPPKPKAAPKAATPRPAAPKAAPARKPAPKPAAKPAARAPVAAAKRPAAKPAAKAKTAAVKTKAKAAPKAKAATTTKAKAKAASDVTWYNVVASREVLGGTGACRVIEPRGYSELSTNPGASLSSLDFNALGGLPCLTGLYIRNPANGKTVGAVKQDKGAGSSFHPVMGLYPQTLADLGLDTGGGEFHVQIRRQDGKALHPSRGTAVKQAGGTIPGPSAPAQEAYFNPLKHAKVTPERVDQGVDYGVQSGYLTAIADGEVSFVSGQAWQPYGNYVEYKITQPGEFNGVYVYYAEGVNPVVREGERIRGGARIANLIDGWHYGIEIGFAAGNGKAWTYSRYHDGTYKEGTSTRAGIAFNDLLKRLGAPGGIVQSVVEGSFPEFISSGSPAQDVNLAGTVSGTPDTTTEVSFKAQIHDLNWAGGVENVIKAIMGGSNQAAHMATTFSQDLQKITYMPPATKGK